MTPESFQQYADKGYNRIPLSLEVLADLDTPLSTYLKLAKGKYSYLLESVQGGDQWGRYSMIGLPARTILRINGYVATILKDGEVIEERTVDDPLAFVEEFQSRYKALELPDLPRFHGGLVGYFGYDTIRYIEPKLEESCPPDEIGTPDILFMVSDEVVVFDNVSGKITFIILANPDTENAFDIATRRLKQLAHDLIVSPLEDDTNDQHLRQVSEKDFHSRFGEEEFKLAVSDIKDYVMAGDIMQCVISQRMSVEFDESPLTLYRALRILNPSPYMYFMDLDDFHIAGASPEILARLEGDEVTVRPIAGTRFRGQDEAHDLAMEKELLADPKEIAEHLMLIDLGRNDAGRVSEIGSVKVTDQMVIERYSHVMHIVSNVKGKLLPEKTAIDVIRATHPAGTLSGAPKIRAMEIIDEFEPVKRGVYGGAVGYLGWNGNMDMAIAIRTAVIKDGKLNVQAGAGVVADSVPKLEWKETMNKARAVMKATEMAANGLKLS